MSIYLPSDKVTYSTQFLSWELENYGVKLPHSPIKPGRRGIVAGLGENNPNGDPGYVVRVLWDGNDHAVSCHTDNIRPIEVK